MKTKIYSLSLSFIIIDWMPIVTLKTTKNKIEITVKLPFCICNKQNNTCGIVNSLTLFLGYCKQKIFSVSDNLTHVIETKCYQHSWFF